VKNTLPVRLLFWALLSLYFLFIGYEVLTSDYLFTDEAFMFWHQSDHHLTFKIWVSIGRVLSGWLKDWMFGVSKTIADIKYIRFCSVLQCFLATLVAFLCAQAPAEEGASLFGLADLLHGGIFLPPA